MYKYVFIGSLYDYNEFIEKEITMTQDNVFTCKRFEEKLNPTLNLLYKIHNGEKVNRVLKLPFRGLWAKKILDNNTVSNLSENDQICFIYSGSTAYLRTNLLRYLKKKYPRSKFVFCFTDLIDAYLRNNPTFFDKYASSFDLLMTYNREDADKYCIAKMPPKIIDYSSVNENETIPRSDLFFIGKEKGRLYQLLEIYEKCVSFGLKCDFHIMDVPKEKQIYSDSIIYNKYMTYEEVISRVKRTKCVLNYIQKGSSGITLRDYEAIGMNKLLMTNNSEILASDFYSPEMIIWIDNLDDEYLKIFKPIPVSGWPGKERYSIKNYFMWLESMIERT